MKKAETILKEHVDTLHRLAEALLEREILDAEEIDTIIRGESLPPVQKENNNVKNTQDEVPEHVKKLMEQRSKQDSTSKDDAN